MTYFVDQYNLPDCTVLRRERDRLGYLRGHTDALRRLKAGERQEQCARCQRYAWPDNRRACEDFTPDEPVAIQERINDEGDLQ